METTLQFLEAVKARHGLPSDYALAKKLGLSPQAISMQKKRSGTMDDSTALRVAELLEIDAGIVLAAVHRERAKTESEKAAWKAIIEKLGGIAAALLIGLGGLSAPSPTQASTFDNNQAGNTDYAKQRRRGKNANRHKPVKNPGLDPLTLFHFGISAR